MTVYVDDANLRHRGQLWSHMVADTAEELHRAAGALGLSRDRAQDRGRTLHYDLPTAWRRRAIETGIAEPISWRAMVARRATIAGRDLSRERRTIVRDAAPQRSVTPFGGVSSERL